MPVTTRPISKYTKSQSDETATREVLANISVEQLTQAYMEKRISVQDYNYWMREKARLEIDGALRRDGLPMTIWQEAAKNTIKAWNDLLTAFKGVANPPAVASGESKTNPAFGGTWNEEHGRLYFASLALYREVQLVTGWLTAIGDVSRQKIENMALNEGASVGLARVYGIVGEHVVTFPILGFAMKGFGKAVQTGAKITGKGATTVKSAAEVSKESLLEIQALQTIAEGVQVDGVKEAANVLEQAGKVIGKEFTLVNPTMVARPARFFDPESFGRDFAKEAAAFAKENPVGLPALARKFGIDSKEILAADEAQLYGHLKALEKYSDQLVPRAKAALAGTVAEQHEFGQFVSSLFGRFGSRDLMDFLVHWNPQLVASGDIAGALRSLAENLSVLSNSNAAKLTFGSQEGFLKLGTFGPGLRELYFNLLLPFSLVPSFIGNSLAVSNHVMERATGSLFFGDTSLRSTVHFAKGMQFAMMDAVSAFGAAYRRMDATQAAQFVAMTGSRLDYIPHQIPGTIGQIINGIGTSPTLGLDNFFKVLIRRGLMYETAADEAYALGLTGSSLGSYINTRVVHPAFLTTYAAEWEARARTMTYQGEMGYMMKHLQPVLQWGPGVLYFPFVKTGVNLTKYSWDRTPGLQMLNTQLYKDIINGGSKGDEAIGRLILSNLFGHMNFELAKDGYITGSGPLNPKTRDSWSATHEPYSFATPKGWVPFPNLDPVTAPVGFMADFAQLADQLNEVTGGKLARAAVTAMLQNFPNRTWWRNMSDLQDQIKGLREGKPLITYSEQVLGAPLITGITGGAITQRLKQINDPIQRDARTLMDLVKARVPYFSEELPPKTDGYGDPLIPSQTLGGAWFGLFSPLAPKLKPAQEDSVKQEGDRLNATLPKFSKTVGGRTQHTEDDLADFDILPIHPGDSLGVDLSPQQSFRWKQLYKELWSDPKDGIKAQLLESKEYSDPKLMPKALQRITYEGTMRKYKQAAWNMLLVEDKELLERVVSAKVGNEMQKLGDPKERARLQQDLQLTLTDIRGMTRQQRDNLLHQDHTIEETPIEQPNYPPEIINELH